MSKFDLVIIGGGPAGYVGALHAANHGMSVGVVEKEALGGVCLNWGCIPTKSFLYAGKLYKSAKDSAAWGVTASDVNFDYGVAYDKTETVKDTLRTGIAGLFKRAGIEHITGEAKLTSATTVEVDGNTLEAKNILIATGSRAMVPPVEGLALSENVVDNVGMLAAKELPSSLAIIGGGVIGVEFASFAASVGVDVTIIEMLDEICPGVDKELSRILRQKLTKSGIKINLESRVTKVDGTTLTFVDKNDAESTLTAERILVATGRTPNVELGLEAAGVLFDTRTGIKVDATGRTNVPSVYAAGDVTCGIQLAHYASRAAEIAVDNMLGKKVSINNDRIPSVIYSSPEIASVGLTEDEARERGIEVKTAKMMLGASGRFLAETNGERGVCKVVVGATHKEILGVHIIGPYASEMIPTAAIMLEAELLVTDVEKTVFPHPTVAEIIRETVLTLI